MTNVNLSYKDLTNILGKKVPQDEILEKIPLLGSDIGDNVPGTDEMSIEFFPNRPDLYSVEGIGRQLRQFLNIEPGMKTYKVSPSGIKAIVTPEVKKIRPYFVCCVVCGVKIDDTVLRSIMDLQEKLHLTVGRKRTKVAIGIHDLDKVTPPFTFKAVKPDEISFVPLAKTEPMTPKEILTKHEKGVAYQNLLDGFKEYPIIFDSKGQVLSFPPIINGQLTTVTTDTRNLLVDVTGFDYSAVEGILNIVCTALAERGGEIKSIEMEGQTKKSYPNLEPEIRKVDLSECRKIIGLDISQNDAIDALSRMGLGAKKISDDKLEVSIPPYRLDVIHDVDVYEDIAIGYGYEKYGKEKRSVVQTAGKLLPETEFSSMVQDVMIGLGYTELTTLTLSNRKDEFELSGLPEVDCIEITNPITEEHTILRAYLMPSLMRILRHNKHHDLPQKIFETGFVIRNNKNTLHLCALQATSKSSFTEVKSVAESILRELSVDYKLSSCTFDTFVPGRGAFIESGGKKIGVFGEMSPKVIVGYEMIHPVTFIEIDISTLVKDRTGALI